MFGRELNNVYDKNNIHDNDVNNISEWNLRHDISNTYICVKSTNSNYFPILHGFMNTRRGKSKYKTFLILLYSRRSSKKLTIIQTSKIITTKYTMTQWKTQVGNITTYHKVKVSFCIHEFSVIKIVMWEYHWDDYCVSRFDVIIGIGLLPALVLNLKSYEHVI